MRPFHSVLPLACVLLAAPGAASADRITRMTQEERCVYTARLQVAAAYYFKQGKPRQELKIHWHGDETEGEIRFVTENIDAGYSAMAREVESSGRGVPVEIVGDRVYIACMKQTAL